MKTLCDAPGGAAESKGPVDSRSTIGTIAIVPSPLVAFDDSWCLFQLILPSYHPLS